MTNDETIANLIATAQPRTQQVRVCARGDLVARHAVLVAELADAEKATEGSLSGSSEVQRISQEIVAVEQEQEDSTVTIKMGSVSRRIWADLLATHHPRTQDKGLEYNPDTFPPAVLAACAIEPTISRVEADGLMDVLPPAEWVKLWMAALALNVTETPYPKLAAATELARANGGSSTTQANGAFPDPSS